MWVRNKWLRDKGVSFILHELQGFPVFQGFPRVQRVSGGSGINSLATTEFLMFFKGFQSFSRVSGISRFKRRGQGIHGFTEDDWFI